MALPPGHLLPGEHVVAEVNPHWACLVAPCAALLAAIAVSVGVVIAFPSAPVAVLYLLAVLLVAPVLWLVARSVRRRSRTIVVTSERVLRRTGLMARSLAELRLERITELSSHQTIGQRLIGCGTVVVESGSDAAVLVLHDVPRPAVIQSTISAQLSAWHRSTRSAASEQLLQPRDTPPAGTVLGQL